MTPMNFAIIILVAFISSLFFIGHFEKRHPLQRSFYFVAFRLLPSIVLLTIAINIIPVQYEIDNLLTDDTMTGGPTIRAIIPHNEYHTDLLNYINENDIEPNEEFVYEGELMVDILYGSGVTPARNHLVEGIALIKFVDNEDNIHSSIDRYVEKPVSFWNNLRFNPKETIEVYEYRIHLPIN